MSDDLVKDLRFWNGGIDSDKKMRRAADRIEQLEAANLKAACIKVDDMARIEQLEAALRHAHMHLFLALSYNGYENGPLSMPSASLAEREARAALEGKKDE